MISRVTFGWQTTMADLALILFMITAAGIHAQQQQKQQGHEERGEAGRPLPASGEPLAIYRAREGAPPLGEWLAEQAPDRRQYLTIVARYRGDAAAAAHDALGLAEEAAAAGVAARIVLEPGEGDDLLATLAFDRPGVAVARPLQPAS